MSADLLAVIVSAISLIITIRSWYVTDMQQKELERLKGEIQRINSEHDTRFAYLHQRRGRVIDKLYKLIDETIGLFDSSIRLGRFNGEVNNEEQRDEAIKTYIRMIKYYNQNRLYLDQALCDQIDELIPMLFEISSRLSTPIGFMGPIPVTTEQFNAASKIVQEKLPPIRSLIEKEMRAILGVDLSVKSIGIPKPIE